MNTEKAWRSFNDRLKQTYPPLSEGELMELHYSLHYSSRENTRAIPSDIQANEDPNFHRALAGRFWLCRSLTDDKEMWDTIHLDFKTISAHLPHKPPIIAAALAIRPINDEDWATVEAWSWVYRHALMLDVAVADFGSWCVAWTPETSRAAVIAELMRSGHVEAQPSTNEVTVLDSPNGDA